MAPPDKKKKNLLEAFRNAGDGGSAEPSSDGGSGPFASRPSKEGPLPPPGPVSSAAPAWLPWAIAVVIAFVLGLAVGRGSVDGVEASAGEDAERADGAREERDATSNAGSGVIPRDRERLGGGETGGENPAPPPSTALDDPANQYTVVAAAYGKSRLEYAWRNVEYLESKGLPAFAPIDQKRHILILVGAAPDRASLADLERRVQALDGPDGEPKAYGDAYTDQIDKFLDRR